ncbi:hypothetical protein [Microbacterium sp. No. 7]|uniref:hypothetical protein n=1 Tax=Microbacterium sp. No. 7 TaxID=1714373 RepID=UPI0006D01D69|nr:hypothetical protein [Microbacterium sp. No. 7]ALJ19094.1 hypothetical protein AOA12_03915 [Microbacterium sp. No. 7]
MGTGERNSGDGTASRRAVVKAGAWAAPIVAAAVAAPLAAATTTSPPQTGKALVLTALGVYGYQSWDTPYLAVNFDYYYQYGNFPGGNYPSNVPAQIMTSWTLNVIDTTTNAAVISLSGDAVLTQTGSTNQFAFRQNVPGAAPYLVRGRAYRVELSVVAAVAYNAAGEGFQADPLSGAVTATA